MSGLARCRTCGRWVPSAVLVQGRWCSQECARSFASCATCGSWFTAGSGFDGEHCSRECAIRYIVVRRYGPEPVALVVET